MLLVERLQCCVGGPENHQGPASSFNSSLTKYSCDSSEKNIECFRLLKLKSSSYLVNKSI